jgi:putative endopeptidase
MSDTDLLATIGFTIAHEISHGFDFIGTQFNAYGEANPVFTEADVEAFSQRTTRLADYYSTMEPMPGVNCDGRQLVTEAAADLSGMQATLLLAKKTEGFDYDRFCSTFGTAWAEARNQEMFLASLADMHPLFNLRMNVCSQMCDEMYDALGVQEGDGMYLAPEQRVLIWGEKA